MLEFCETYGHLDIWRETDTTTGEVQYVFWNMGIAVTGKNEKEILEKADKIINLNKGKSR